MSIFPKLRKKNPFDSMKLGDLKKAEAQITYQIQTLNNEKAALEKQIATLFNEASAISDEVGTSRYTMRIKSTSESWQLKAQTCLHLEGDLQLFSNMIAIKEQEKTLQRSGIHQKLQNSDPVLMEEWLAKSGINNGDQRAMINDLSEITSEHISQSGVGSADESYIRSLIDEMRTETISSDSAGTKLFSSMFSEQLD